MFARVGFGGAASCCCRMFGIAIENLDCNSGVVPELAWFRR